MVSCCVYCDLLCWFGGLIHLLLLVCSGFSVADLWMVGLVVGVFVTLC